MLATIDVKRVNENGQEEGYVLGPGEGERLSAVGVEMTFKALGGDTDDEFIFVEYEAPPNFPGPPPHWHKEAIEAFYVVDGTVTLTIGDEEVKVGPGTTVYVPTGVVHSFANESDEPARFVFLAAPPGLDEYFFKLMDMVAAEPTWPPEDPEKLKAVGALAREYDQYPPETAPEDGDGQAIIHHPGTGNPVTLMGNVFHFITDTENTDGQLATLLYEGTSEVQGPPPHYHKETAEVGYMLEGTITLRLGDRDVEAGPGSFFYIPPNLVHSWSNSGGGPVKFLGFGLPAGIEGYFSEMVELMKNESSWPPEDMGKVAALAQKYDQYMVKQPV